MNKILQATARGQVTLPKKWREKYKTVYFKAETVNDSIVLTPLLEVGMEKDLEKELEKSWGEYKKGKYVDAEELEKKYGL